MAYKKQAAVSAIEEIRTKAENDLLSFIRLVAPYQVLGEVHEEICRWWTRPDAKNNQLLLLPRDHQKSRLVAFRVAWTLTREPTATFLYISATSTLAKKQLSFIKQILDSEIYRRYWPLHLLPDQGQRSTWNANEIILDHPSRAEEGVRDSSVFTAGLTTTITGLHFKYAVLDDVVVKENAYTEDGRQKTRDQYSLLASIESADAEEWVVGTRYHPRDLYHDLIEMEEEVYNEEGELKYRDQVYEVFSREVEDVGDGSGKFIWPRQQRADGAWFGYNARILAQKKAKYKDRVQFYAQYYNRPEDRDNPAIDPNTFQYYDRSMLIQSKGRWTYNGKVLNVFAAVDFAFSRSIKADRTSIVVIGVDFQNNVYVLDIATLKTDKISDYYKEIARLYVKWEYQKIRAEVSVAQQVIVREIKETYLKPSGLSIRIDEYRPNRYEGTKQERIATILEPRYDMRSVWHFKGGLCEDLEEELVLQNPAHDDIKDSLANAIAISLPPMRFTHMQRDKSNVVSFHPKFGGVSL